MICIHCGSNKLQQRAWIDYKTAKVVDRESQFFCDDCGSHFAVDVLIIKTKYASDKKDHNGAGINQLSIGL